MSDVTPPGTVDSSRLDLDHSELYGEYHERVWSLMRKMVGRQDAQDLTQQVFVKVIERGGSFQRRSSVWTWLYRVAANEALSHLRRQKLRRHVSLNGEPAMKLDEAEHRFGDAKEALARALDELDPLLRVVFVLKEVEKLSYREIAESVGIPEGTVGSRLNRARHELRRHLVRFGVRV